eukprot:6429931-Prymnesium_polylepis.1
MGNGRNVGQRGPTGMRAPAQGSRSPRAAWVCITKGVPAFSRGTPSTCLVNTYRGTKTGQRKCERFAFDTSHEIGPPHFETPERISRRKPTS